jgi:hypothetical protein
MMWKHMVTNSRYKFAEIVLSTKEVIQAAEIIGFEF